MSKNENQGVKILFSEIDKIDREIDALADLIGVEYSDLITMPWTHGPDIENRVNELIDQKKELIEVFLQKEKDRLLAGPVVKLDLWKRFSSMK